jgi:molecular chaperone HscC
MLNIGIDLGTTNSLIAIWKDGKSILIPNAHGNFLTPSVVSIDDDGSVLVGDTVKERLISHSDLTIANFKRHMGSDKKFQLAKKYYRSEELSSLVLHSDVIQVRFAENYCAALCL